MEFSWMGFVIMGLVIGLVGLIYVTVEGSYWAMCKLSQKFTPNQSFVIMLSIICTTSAIIIGLIAGLRGY
jgi:predicted lysophospholipase L1 biosynthesis ABC-type transport system permease subunit